MKSIPLLLLLLGFHLLWGVSLYGETRLLWNIPVTVFASAEGSGSLRESVERCFRRMKEVGERLNYYNPESEVSRINRNSGVRAVRVSDETFSLIEKALWVSDLVGGAFDITVRPLSSLWDFRRGRVPSPEEIERAKRRVGYRKVVLNKEERSVFLTEKGMEIDLGGILKGYLADLCTEILREGGASAGMVVLGGDIRVFGTKPGGDLWRVGIRNPRGDGIIALLEIEEGAVSTSGDYERFFIKEGRRYHHVLDPRSGYPAEGVWSATVVAEEGVLADALSTALLVVGAEGLKDLLKRLSAEFVVVEEGGRVRASGGLKLITPAP